MEHAPYWHLILRQHLRSSFLTWTGVILWKFSTSNVSKTAFERPKPFHSDFILLFKSFLQLFTKSFVLFTFTLCCLFWFVTSFMSQQSARNFKRYKTQNTHYTSSSTRHSVDSGRNLYTNILFFGKVFILRDTFSPNQFFGQKWKIGWKNFRAPPAHKKRGS